MVRVGRGRPMSRSAKRAEESSIDFGQVESEGIARGAQIFEGCCLFNDDNGSKKEGREVGWWADCMTKEMAGGDERKVAVGEETAKRRTEVFIGRRREEMRM